MIQKQETEKTVIDVTEEELEDQLNVKHLTKLQIEKQIFTCIETLDLFRKTVRNHGNRNKVHYIDFYYILQNMYVPDSYIIAHTLEDTLAPDGSHGLVFNWAWLFFAAMLHFVLAGMTLISDCT